MSGVRHFSSKVLVFTSEIPLFHRDPLSSVRPSEASLRRFLCSDPRCYWKIDIIKKFLITFTYTYFFIKFKEIVKIMFGTIFVFNTINQLLFKKLISNNFCNLYLLMLFLKAMLNCSVYYRKRPHLLNMRPCIYFLRLI